MAGYVLVCESAPVLNADNTVSCDAWVSVPKSDLFQMDLTQAEISDLATATLTFFTVCFVVRIILKAGLIFATDKEPAD